MALSAAVALRAARAQDDEQRKASGFSSTSARSPAGPRLALCGGATSRGARELETARSFRPPPRRPGKASSVPRNPPFDYPRDDPVSKGGCRARTARAPPARAGPTRPNRETRVRFQGPLNKMQPPPREPRPPNDGVAEALAAVAAGVDLKPARGPRGRSPRVYGDRELGRARASKKASARRRSRRSCCSRRCGARTDGCWRRCRRGGRRAPSTSTSGRVISCRGTRPTPPLSRTPRRGRRPRPSRSSRSSIRTCTGPPTRGGGARFFVRFLSRAFDKARSRTLGDVRSVPDRETSGRVVPPQAPELGVAATPPRRHRSSRRRAFGKTTSGRRPSSVFPSAARRRRGRRLRPGDARR